MQIDGLSDSWLHGQPYQLRHNLDLFSLSTEGSLSPGFCVSTLLEPLLEENAKTKSCYNLTSSLHIETVCLGLQGAGLSDLVVINKKVCMGPAGN